MNDYERIAEVIRFLEQNRETQPSLAALARHVGLGESRIHRLFVDWAGVTPKAFLKCLTIEDAKRRLKEGGAVLDAAIDSGLSGPGRLHDLCVSLEAASPGEIKSGGEGMVVRFGFSDSLFGRCLVAEGDRGICWLEFVDGEGIEGLETEWFGASLERDDPHAERLVRQIFSDRTEAGNGSGLRALVKGTAFQVQVWRALLRIPEGRLVTYQSLARSLDRPGASRAVGSAVAKNPLAYLIPCHRVIRGTGVIGEYRWGSTRKRALVGREGLGPVAPGA